MPMRSMCFVKFYAALRVKILVEQSHVCVSIAITIQGYNE